jgi:hypothetical protein
LLTGSAATWETSNANALWATMATCLLVLYSTAWCESLIGRSLASARPCAARCCRRRKWRGEKKVNCALSTWGREEERRRRTAECLQRRALCLFFVSLKKKPSDAVAPFTLTGHWAAGTDT